MMAPPSVESLAANDQIIISRMYKDLAERGINGRKLVEFFLANCDLQFEEVKEKLKMEAEKQPKEDGDFNIRDFVRDKFNVKYDLDTFICFWDVREIAFEIARTYDVSTLHSAIHAKVVIMLLFRAMAFTPVPAPFQ